MLLCRSRASSARHPQEDRALRVAAGRGVVSAKDVDNIYKVPLWYADEGVDDFIIDHFGLDAEPPTSTSGATSRAADEAEQPVRIALVGKYVQLEDAYLSVARPAPLRLHARAQIEIDWVDSGDARRASRAPRGSARPTASSSRRLRRPRHRGQDPRRRRSPASARSRTSAVCLGMQSRVRVRPPRRRHAGANSTEFDIETEYR
jgi:CTP synthase